MEKYLEKHTFTDTFVFLFIMISNAKCETHPIQHIWYSEHVAHAWRKICVFEKKNRFVTTSDLIKCIKHIK